MSRKDVLGFRVPRALSIMLFAYLVFLLVFGLMVALFLPQMTATFDRSLLPGFTASFVASFFEDFLFFGVLGVLSLYLAMRNPEDEEFTVRLKSVANGKAVNDRVGEYFVGACRELLAYNSDLKLVVTVKRMSESPRALELHVRFETTIRNMCKDVRYQPIKAQALVESDACVGDTWGSVSYLTVSGGEEDHEVVLGDPISIDKAGFRREIPYEVPEDGEVKYRLHYSIWSKLDEDIENLSNWFFTCVSRYTDRVSLEVSNELDQDVAVEIRYPKQPRGSDETDTKLVIKSESTKRPIPEIQLNPTDRVYMFFRVSD
ncbi:MAG: hypothetical protein AAGA68_19310 [Pseudomonadota bacterium]